MLLFNNLKNVLYSKRLSDARNSEFKELDAPLKLNFKMLILHFRVSWITELEDL